MNTFRGMLGATDPLDSLPGTIRLFNLIFNERLNAPLKLRRGFTSYYHSAYNTGSFKKWFHSIPVWFDKVKQG